MEIGLHHRDFNYHSCHWEIKWRWLAQATCTGVRGGTDRGAKKYVADEDVLTALNRQLH